MKNMYECENESSTIGLISQTANICGLLYKIWGIHGNLALRTILPKWSWEWLVFSEKWKGNQVINKNLTRRKIYYRVLVSIVFGLIGFWINFLDIELFENSDFKVSILIGLLFPMTIAHVWGWRYGLLSALAGGCQTMWWLWRADGYGFLYSVPVFTIWVVWHGYWTDFRRNVGRLR